MTPFLTGLLSFLFPGLGQASVGQRGRAVLVALPAAAVLGSFGLILARDPGALTGPAPDSRLLASLLILDLLAGGYHVWAVLDAYVLARRAREEVLWVDVAPRKWLIALSVGVLVTGTVAVHAAAAGLSVAWQRDLSCKSGGTPCWFDISYPQCGGPYPDNVEVGIVGVNHGKVFTANPCLSSGDSPPELTWAGGVNAELYANTGNPGPALSTRWPRNQASPRTCDTQTVPGSDTADCAYDYGWNAAADAYGTAVDAYVHLGLAPTGSTRTPLPNTWWLDVETVNSWRDDPSLNVATLRGAVAYLESVDVANVGFYSTKYQWTLITGGTSDFAAYPSWVAGAGSEAEAVDMCGGGGFTGGSVALVQYHTGRFDGDFRCPDGGS